MSASDLTVTVQVDGGLRAEDQATWDVLTSAFVTEVPHRERENWSSPTGTNGSLESSRCFRRCLLGLIDTERIAIPRCARSKLAPCRLWGGHDGVECTESVQQALPVAGNGACGPLGRCPDPVPPPKQCHQRRLA